MTSQDNSAESKLGQNWKTIAIVATILMVGAVMGHSLLTSDQADSEGTPAKQACQGCQASGTCADQEKSQTNADAAFASVSESSCCAQTSTEDATTDAISKSSCCGEKAQTNADAAFASVSESSCCAQTSTEDATTDAISESGCCGKKAAGGADSSEMFQTSLTCGGCEPDSQ